MADVASHRHLETRGVRIMSPGALWTVTAKGLAAGLQLSGAVQSLRGGPAPAQLG